MLKTGGAYTDHWILKGSRRRLLNNFKNNCAYNGPV
jgi:hypothetical protein